MGIEPIQGLPEATVSDFWRWAYSDLLSNTVRPLFAEYLVAAALGVTGAPRVEWDAVDLRYEGMTLEVKCSGYLQSWAQARPSKIVFDLRERTQHWDAATNTTHSSTGRIADCYVFCVHTDADHHTSQVLDTGHWEFYVVPTRVLNERLGSQGRAGLSTIRKLAAPVGYAGLRGAVDTARVSATQK